MRVTDKTASSDRRLPVQTVSRAPSKLPENVGMATATSIPMIATTMSISIRVNPLVLCFLMSSLLYLLY